MMTGTENKDLKANQSERTITICFHPRDGLESNTCYVATKQSRKTRIRDRRQKGKITNRNTIDKRERSKAQNIK